MRIEGISFSITLADQVKCLNFFRFDFKSINNELPFTLGRRVIHCERLTVYFYFLTDGIK